MPQMQIYQKRLQHNNIDVIYHLQIFCWGPVMRAWPLMVTHNLPQRSSSHTMVALDTSDFLIGSWPYILAASPTNHQCSLGKYPQLSYTWNPFTPPAACHHGFPYCFIMFAFVFADEFCIHKDSSRSEWIFSTVSPKVFLIEGLGPFAEVCVEVMRTHREWEKKTQKVETERRH